MKVRELAAALAALPEDRQDLPVFSTADWDTVDVVCADLYEDEAGRKYVEISTYA